MDKLTELTRKLNNLIRYARVVDVTGARCRVAVGGLTSAPLPWLTQRAGSDITWWAPSVGEQVLWLSPGGRPEGGIILPAVFSDAHPAPSTDEDVVITRYRDGTVASYDTSAHAMTLTVPNNGTLTLNVTGSVTVNSPKIDLGEAAALEPSVLGDKLAAWINDELKLWLDTHQHIGNLGVPTSAAMTSPTGPFLPGAAAAGEAVYSKKNRNQ